MSECENGGWEERERRGLLELPCPSVDEPQRLQKVEEGADFGYKACYENFTVQYLKLLRISRLIRFTLLPRSLFARWYVGRREREQTQEGKVDRREK